MGHGTIVDRTQLSAAILTVAHRLAGMVQELPDTDIAIPGCEWTVGESAAHLAYTNIGLAIMAKGLAIPYGDGTRAGFAEANALSLEAYPDRDGPLLAGRIVDGAKAFVAEAAAQPPGGVYQTPMGSLDMDTFASYVLTHNLMHGCAMADGLRAPYPFEPEHAALVWPFLSHALQVTFDEAASRGLQGRIQVTVEGSFSAALVLGDGTLSVENAATGPVDCFVSADPLTFFLVTVKLLAVEHAVDRGAMLISGPSRELGMMLPSLFEMP